MEKYIILVVFFVSVITIFCAFKDKKSKIKYDILTDTDGFLCNYIKDIIYKENIFGDMIIEGKLYSLYYFKEECIDIIFGIIKNKYIDDLNTSIVAKFDVKIDNEMLLECIEDTLNNNEAINTFIGHTYMDMAMKAVQEAEREEREAATYIASFGIEAEGDPELHPKDTNSGTYESSDIIETDADSLLSTGTVEYIED